MRMDNILIYSAVFKGGINYRIGGPGGPF